MKGSFLLFLFVFVTWTLVRLFVPIKDGWEELLIKPVLFLIPTFFLIRSERQKRKQTSLPNAVMWGMIAGALLILFAEGINHFLKGQPSRISVDSLTRSNLLFNLCVSLMTAFCEEMVFRAYIFRQLLIKKGLLFASFFSTAGFVLLHVPRIIFVLHYSGAELFIYLYMLFFLSVVNTLAYWRTKNVVSSTIPHALWNFYGSL